MSSIIGQSSTDEEAASLNATSEAVWFPTLSDEEVALRQKELHHALEVMALNKAKADLDTLIMSTVGHVDTCCQDDAAHSAAMFARWVVRRLKGGSDTFFFSEEDEKQVLEVTAAILAHVKVVC
jgi:hypothetical protein